ncbi:hypothetical protein J4Q44_G00023380 [Coregonus suidteri]|uniref:Receptor ligand binding region domain-containing protein n=1 Tax=Coregonus suidteri TaxID=861788 RepID=A0AAN8MH57_9TELE
MEPSQRVKGQSKDVPDLPKGVVSVIGPANSPASGSTVSHICGEKEIPHVKIGPEETPRLPYLRFASVSLYPSNEDLSLAVAAILRSFSYPSASLVCAKAECLLRLEELVRRFLISRETLSIRMLDDSLDPTPLLKEIRDDKVATIIIDANASISYLILKKASELGMTSAFYKYILTTMDFPLLRLDDIVDDQSNIIGFSMFNTTHPFYLEFIRSLNLSWREGCDLIYPGPAKFSQSHLHHTGEVVGNVTAAILVVLTATAYLIILRKSESSLVFMQTGQGQEDKRAWFIRRSSDSNIAKSKAHDTSGEDQKDADVKPAEDVTYSCSGSGEPASFKGRHSLLSVKTVLSGYYPPYVDQRQALSNPDRIALSS